MPGIFISGTDTGIGKTLTSALLCSALKQSGGTPGYFKPVQTGQDDDVQTVRELAGLSDESLQAPVYAFPDPISPNRAAEIQKQEIELPKIVATWAKLPPKSWVVEGAGGVMVPLSARAMIRDLVKALDLPLLVATSTRLGTINHTLLTIEAAQRAGVRIAGMVLHGPKDPGLVQVLESFSGAKVLAEVPKLELVNAEAVKWLAPEVFPRAVLARIFGEGAK